MTNQQFEKWVSSLIVFSYPLISPMELAHAIRNKVLHEAIEVIEIEGHNICKCDNECCCCTESFERIKSSLLNLLTKE